MKLNVFFRLKNGQIVEVQDQLDVEKLRTEIERDEHFVSTNFDLFKNKVELIANQDFFKDAEIIASSFGPLNI